MVRDEPPSLPTYWILEVCTHELEFSLNTFWIQVHNFPLENLNS